MKNEKMGNMDGTMEELEGSKSRCSRGRHVMRGRCRSLRRRCGRVGKEKRARFYILRRCVTMLLCWHERDHARYGAPPSLADSHPCTSGFASSATLLDVFVVEEGHCFMCSPEEDNGRIGSSGLNVNGRISKLDLLLISTVVVAFLISSAAFFVIGYNLIRRSQSPSLSRTPLTNKRSEGGRFPTLFSQRRGDE